MPQTLVDAALAQAERADPSVLAAACLHAARVMSMFDQAEAERLFDRGVAVARELRPDDRRPLMHAAVALGATVAPGRAMALAARELTGHEQSGALMSAVFGLLEQDRRDEVAALLIDFPASLPFPFSITSQAVNPGLDLATRRSILESAVRAFQREQAEGRLEQSFRGLQEFMSLLRDRWSLLPRDEARQVVREVVEIVLKQADEPIHASFGEARFSSTRQFRLFEILGPLRRLDPERAESLIAAHPQLAKAAAAMPFGLEMMPPEPDDPADVMPTPRTPARKPIVPLAAREDVATNVPGGFSDPASVRGLDLALRKFKADTNGGNSAPKEVWPSTYEYRSVVYNAAREHGRSAIALLDRIADADIRALAAIELAAGLVGLPQAGGMTVSPGTRSRRAADPPPDLPPEMMAELQALMAQRVRQPLPLPARPDLPPSRDVRITPSTRQPGARPAGGAGSDFWTMEGMRLRPVLSKICSMPETRIEIPQALDEGCFDFALVLPGDESHEAMKRLMREGIAAHFRVDIVRESRATDVYVLTAPDAVTLQPTDERHGGMSGGFTMRDVVDVFRSATPEALPQGFEEFDLRQVMDLHLAGEDMTFRPYATGPPRGVLTSISGGLTMEELCDTLEHHLGRPVVDETGLAGSYDLSVDSEVHSTFAFLDALCDHTGLLATSARREVEMLIVRARGSGW